MNINPRQMKKMMQQMGIKQKEIPCEEVIIRSVDKEIIVTNPQVMKVNMMGQDTFQISGEISERESIREEDIQTVMEKAGVSHEKALEKLKDNEGDLAKSILELK